MRNAYLFALIAALAIAATGRLVNAQDAKDTAPDASDALTPTVKLELEVDALTTLNDLNLSKDQLSALKDLAADTAGTLSEKPTPVTDEYISALKDLREALLGRSEDKIDTAEDRVGDLGDKQDDDSEPDVVQSGAAKKKGPELLKALSVKQVAEYLSANADDVDDPTQLLIDAIHQSRGMDDNDFADLRDDTAQEIGIFAGGSNPAKTPQVVNKVKNLLTKAHKMSNSDYATQQSQLEDDAHKLVGGGDPIPSMRHWMENEMADLLANPELLHATDEWTAAGK
jgi:hypothetical protein